MNQDIATIQQLLKNHGFDPGEVDGLYGRNTQGALVAALKAALAGAAALEPLDENDALLVAELRRDEGTVLSAYQDSEGYWTIGTGRLIDKRLGGGISQEENDILLMNDIRAKRADLDRELPWWRNEDPVRRRAIQNLCFNLGITKLLKFQNTLAAWRKGDYEGAARGLEASLWFKQVGHRGPRVVRMVRTGAV